MSVLYETKGDADGRRGYTHVDFGHARVGNRWIERVWSRYLGQTTSLVQKAGELEWVARQNPEYAITVGGERLAVTDFGEPAWSEECDQFGATLVMEQSGHGLDIALAVTAFHDFPVLLRTLRVANTGTASIFLGECAVESLLLEPAPLSIFGPGLEATVAKLEEAALDQPVAVTAGDCGLLIAGDDGCTVTLDPGSDACCVVGHPGSVAVAPHARLDLPSVYLVAFEGPPLPAAHAVLPAARKKIQERDALQVARQAEEDEDGEED